MVVSAKQKKQAAAKDEGGGGGEKEEALLLTKGAVVEVSTEEDGFKDAWFVATIIKPPQPPPPPRPGPKSSNSESPNNSRLQEVYVEYKTLLNDKHPSKPLREHVHVRLVRPLPPPTDHTPSFELYDVVDAFYRDGWWTGVITRLLPGPIFVVTFRNPPHEIHFAFSDLRLHLDWVNNTWVRPIKQKMPGIMYSVGKKVEVLLENDDVWFPATIIEDSGSASFLVEYHTPDEPHSRKVTIDYSRIRPCPPLIKDKGFELLEKVDALSEYGWRAGLVTQELEGNRYKVFFKGTNIAKELSHSEIRPPLRWQDEKWFTVSGDVIIPQQDKPEGLVQSNIDVTNGSINISDGKKSKENQNQNQKKESEESLDSSAKKRTRYPTNEKSNKGEGVDTIIRSLIASQKKTNTSAKQMASDFESPPSNSTRSNLLRARRTTVDNSINPSPGTADTERKRRKIVEDDYITTPISKSTNPGGSANLLTKKRRSSLGSKDKDKDKEGTGSGGQVVEKEKEKEKEKECSHKEADISIIIGLECVKTSGSKADGGGLGGGDESLKVKVDQKQQMNDESSVDNKESGGVGESSQSQKRPRGRPKKVLIKSLSLDNTITEQNGNNKVNECITGNGEELEKENGEKEIAASAEPAAGPIKKLERYSSKRSKRRMTSVNQQDNPSDVSGGGGNNTDNIITKEVSITTTTTSVVVDEKATNEDDMMDDDQPLAKWFEDKMHSPPSAPEGTTSTKFSSPSMNNVVDQSNDLITKKNKSVPVVDPESTIQVDKNVVISSEPEREPEPEPENLPFVKNTTLWATVENMEAFQKIPQKPHFRPLLKCKESSREGLAIASMVTFAGAVVNISKLRFDDPRDKIEDILDSLNDLETHGFDVTLLRDGIANLLSIIDRTQKINGDVMDINSKIVAYKMDKANKDEEIVEMKKQIKELQEKIVLAESVKEVKDAEIALLQKKLLDLDESLSTSRATFDEIAGGVLRSGV